LLHLLGIGVLGAVATIARAAAPAVDLTWNAPPDCPDREVVVNEISRLLGGTQPDRPLPVQAAASQLADGRWSMYLSTPAGERSFEGDSCARLADATAVIIALMIVPATDPPPPALTAAAPLPSPVAPSSRRFQILIRPEGSVLGGPLPNASPGLGLAAGVRSGRLRLEVNGAWGGPSQQVNLPDGAGAVFSMTVRGGVTGCWTPWSQRVEVDACLGAQTGPLNGHGVGVATPETVQTWWVGLSAGGALAYPLTDWALLRLDISAGYSPNQAKFIIEGVDEVHQVAAWTASAGVGVEARF
jgi:hypothetical protein